MSDLLAPVLTEVQNEVDAYWCFVGLMQKTTFFSSPTDIDMDSQLVTAKLLLKLITCICCAFFYSTLFEKSAFKFLICCM